MTLGDSNSALDSRYFAPVGLCQKCLYCTILFFFLLKFKMNILLFFLSLYFCPYRIRERQKK